ncbi:hypothetical protein [Flavihumibacter sp. ZG627]|uniref:hypothetical protein n=1 Tax=Flavihumibacter sp. ZG627 TaxID=1463156 RepID=UPI00057E2491|nr:hypothetical protein [Flavihumibacter sp. ZG627]KIC92241.1 hypothetical protein HY58_01425 [Flavihumibacter sp. ZG627]
MTEILTSRRVYEDRSMADYRLQVIAPEAVREKIVEETNYARNVFGEEAFAGGEDCLVLASFKAREEMEDTLLRWLHRIIGQQEGFGILLNNYGSLPGAPLYLRIQDPTPFHQLVESLRVIDALMKGNQCSSLQLYRTPRLMLMRSMKEERELEMLLDFSARTFRAEMEVEELQLVRQDSDGSIRLVSRLALMPRGLKRKETNNDND